MSGLHRRELAVCRPVSTFHMPPAGRVQVARSRGPPTLSCPARSSQSSCGPMCTRCMLARAFLRHSQLPARGVWSSLGARLGDTSSMLVALRMLMASSDSCLGECQYAYATARRSQPRGNCPYTHLPISTLREDMAAVLAAFLRYPLGVANQSRRRGRGQCRWVTAQPQQPIHKRESGKWLCWSVGRQL
jgi:hypothetical protein